MEESGLHSLSNQSNNSHHHLHVPHHLGKMHLHLPHIHLHSHSHCKKGRDIDTHPDVPKGCMAVKVGQEGEEQQQRFVIAVEHFNHPLFEELLKEMEEEYGFEQKGTITIPCRVSDFQRVHDLIHRDQHDSHAHGTCFHLQNFPKVAAH